MNEVIRKLVLEIFIKSPFFWILMILAVISSVFYKKILGKTGEFYVKNELNRLNKSRYLIINNVTLKSKNFTHQIDHIVVSKYGVFVIETKHYNGYIKGNENDAKWILNKNYYINNPVFQNYGHIKCLKELLELPNNCFISIVCFSSNVKLRVYSKSHVIVLPDLNKVIKSYNNEILSDYIQIYKEILSLNIKDKTVLKQHVKYAKKIAKSKEYTNMSNKCPFCGGHLVNKKGKYGKFVGCSNYPKCKFTKKI